MLYIDAIVIGAGQSGIPLAMKLAKDGNKTALIEKRALGGTCVNDGCTPTKTLIASAENAYKVKHSAKWGVNVPDFSIDFSKIMQRKNEVVNRFRKGSVSSVNKTDHLMLFEGSARFLGPKEIEVALEDKKETIRAESIFIDTGLEPDIPAIEGLNRVPFYTTTTILDITDCPKHLIILGGSYNGLEMAQLFARLGSKVTVVEKSKQLLPKEDQDIAEALQEILEKEGIQVFTGAGVHYVEKEPLALMFSANGNSQQVIGSHLLVATGRKPQTKRLGLKKAGIETDKKGFIKVNDFLETSVSGVFAMGDVKGGPAFTHISYNDHLVVYNNMRNAEKQKYFNRQVPYCMFTDPQLGRVGLTEKEAVSLGKEIEVFSLPMKNNSRGIETGNTEGLMKAIVEKPGGLILGVAILSAQGGEVMSVLQMAMVCGFTAARLREQVFAHPLFSESINNLFMG